MKSRKRLRKVVVRVEAPGPNGNANTVCRVAILLLVVIALGAAAPSRGYAAVRTVCASGCKYTTIAAAIVAAKAGDTIRILDAVHTEWNITVDRNLTIKGLGATKTAVDGGSPSPNGTVFTVDSGVTARFQNLTIRNASNDALVNNGGTVTISDSTLSGNFSYDNGGVFNNGGTIAISNSTLSDNVGVFIGCLTNDDGTVTISNSTLSGNGGEFAGGCLFNNGGTLTISNSTLSGNSTNRGGGAVSNQNGGTVTISDSTLSGNTAAVGGAIVNQGTLTISNSTLSGNTVFPIFGPGFGGAIANGGTLTVSFSTLADNFASAGAVGGGLDNVDSVTLKNSIVGDNSGGDCVGTVTALGANLDTDGSCGTTNFTQVTSAQLNLGPLALNAPGSTATQALLSGSAALGAATDCTDVTENSVTFDQRATLRPDPGDVVCDIGAYEFQEFAGQAKCERKSDSALVQQYGSLSAAASAYGLSTVKALHAAIKRSCGR